MHKATKYTCWICVIIPLLIGSLIGIQEDFLVALGLGCLIAAFIYLLPAFIMVLIPASRNAGKGMFLAAGILLLIGFSVCSGAAISFK